MFINVRSNDNAQTIQSMSYWSAATYRPAR